MMYFMVAWVVIDRQHLRQPAPFASLHSSPLFPLHHLSPLLPIPYGHSYTTAVHQPLCNQSLTHSFYLDGGCTHSPSSLERVRFERNRGAILHSPPQFRPLFSCFCALFCTLLHFFARSKNSTLLFSIDYALFAKNHPGWGTPQEPCQKSRTKKCCSLGLPADPFYRRPDPLTVC